MSWQRGYNWDTARFNSSGPGMNAYNLDRLGWIPMDKILRFGADGKFDRAVTLTALSDPSGSGYMMVRIPISAKDKKRYYTVEYRVPDKWDRGLPESRVLIHEVSNKDAKKCDTGESSGMKYRSYLLGTTLLDPVESINLRGVQIDVISKGRTRARVRIRSAAKRAPGYGPNSCKAGFVWRQIDVRDYVCTTPARRMAVAEENRLADSRRNPSGGAFGYDTCKQGFVWREAWPDDKVCVPASSRTAAAKENEAAYGLLEVP
jgi:hypothetical protein